MPAKSEKQRKFMGRVLSYKRGDRAGASKAVKKAASSMTQHQARDFSKKQHHSLFTPFSRDHTPFGKEQL